MDLFYSWYLFMCLLVVLSVLFKHAPVPALKSLKQHYSEDIIMFSNFLCEHFPLK